MIMKDDFQLLIHHSSRPFSRFLPEVAVDAKVMEDVCSSSESDIRKSGRADAHLLADLTHGNLLMRTYFTQHIAKLKQGIV